MINLVAGLDPLVESQQSVQVMILTSLSSPRTDQLRGSSEREEFPHIQLQLGICHCGCRYTNQKPSPHLSDQLPVVIVCTLSLSVIQIWGQQSRNDKVGLHSSWIERGFQLKCPNISFSAFPLAIERCLWCVWEPQLGHRSEVSTLSLSLCLSVSLSLSLSLSSLCLSVSPPLSLWLSLSLYLKSTKWCWLWLGEHKSCNYQAAPAWLVLMVRDISKDNSPRRGVTEGCPPHLMDGGENVGGGAWWWDKLSRPTLGHGISSEIWTPALL